ncbi:KH domain-containing protein [Candidatus Gottesmanbacteria bacterium]|nr:KH domain-containing protein [Candidatus Gottesmanbacteria bacterium]
MKDTLQFLITKIVDHPEDVSIEETEGEESRVTLTIHVHPDDMGKVIGKSGRIIKALRDLIKLIATKHGIYVDVTIAE